MPLSSLWKCLFSLLPLEMLIPSLWKCPQVRKELFFRLAELANAALAAEERASYAALCDSFMDTVQVGSEGGARGRGGDSEGERGVPEAGEECRRGRNIIFLRAGKRRDSGQKNVTDLIFSP